MTDNYSLITEVIRIHNHQSLTNELSDHHSKQPLIITTNHHKMESPLIYTNSPLIIVEFDLVKLVATIAIIPLSHGCQSPLITLNHHF